MNKGQFKTNVKSGYATILNNVTEKSITSTLFQCCNPKDITKEVGKRIGYSDEQFTQVSENSNLGVGCGNPVALASIKRGETILDLG